jgi:hypothetical protein
MFFVPLRHLLMDDAAARRHPLYVPGTNNPTVPDAVSMFHLTAEDIGNGFDASMGMPWKALDVVFGVVRTKIVEKKEWVKQGNLIVPERSFEVYTCSFDGRPTLPDLLNSSIAAHRSLPSQGPLWPSVGQVAR